MPQQNKINVQILTGGPEDEFGLHEFDNVNYISFVSSPGGSGEGTYGIPAMISEDRVKRDGLPVKILYVNPANIVAMEAERVA